MSLSLFLSYLLLTDTRVLVLSYQITSNTITNTIFTACTHIAAWKELGIDVIPVLSQPDESWTGRKGYVQDALKEDVSI